MNIEKASFSTITRVGNLAQFREKLFLEDTTIDEIKDEIDDGRSLLLSSIANKKFDIALYLLDSGAKVNVVSEEGNNEFHCIAYHLNEDGALDLAYTLLERGVDLDQADERYGNSAFWYICLNARRFRTATTLLIANRKRLTAEKTTYIITYYIICNSVLRNQHDNSNIQHTNGSRNQRTARRVLRACWYDNIDCDKPLCV